MGNQTDINKIIDRELLFPTWKSPGFEDGLVQCVYVKTECKLLRYNPEAPTLLQHLLQFGDGTNHAECNLFPAVLIRSIDVVYVNLLFLRKIPVLYNLALVKAKSGPPRLDHETTSRPAYFEAMLQHYFGNYDLQLVHMFTGVDVESHLNWTHMYGVTGDKGEIANLFRSRGLLQKV